MSPSNPPRERSMGMKKSFDFLDALIASGVEFNAAKPDVMKKFGVDINGHYDR